MAQLRFILTAALLVVLAEASISGGTVINTIEIRERCRSEMAGVDMGRQCQQYIIEAVTEVEEVMMKKVQQHYSSSSSLAGCCDELRQLNPDCRCEGLREVLLEIPNYVLGGDEAATAGEKMEKEIQVAEQLPGMCNVDQPRSCSFSPFTA